LKTLVVARRYAEAFLNALGEPRLDAGFAGLKAFMQAGSQEPQLLAVLRQPSIQLERKLALIDSLIPAAEAPLVGEFLKTLLKRHRFDLFPIIAEEAENLYNQRRRITRVHVRSAVALRDEERKRLSTTLAKRVQGQVILHETIEPHLMGGIVLRFEGRVLDASIQTTLKNLKERLNSLSSKFMSGDAPATTVA